MLTFEKDRRWGAFQLVKDISYNPIDPLFGLIAMP